MLPTVLLIAAFALGAPTLPFGVALQPSHEIDRLPDTPQGRAAAAFIGMINDGSPEAVREFEQTYRAAASTAPIEERTERVERMHADLAPLVVTRVITRGEGRLIAVARAADGRSVVMEFIPAPEGPERIEGVGMRIGGPEVEPVELSSAEVAAAVERAAASVEGAYVYPDVGRRMAASVRDKLAAGGYEDIRDDALLAGELTADLRAVSRDLHLGVRIEPRTSERDDPDDEAMLRELAADNYGFREVRVLPGNVGYIRFDAFVPGPEAEATAAGAMAFVRNCDAVIFDLRSNGGGSPEMIRFITSYLFEEPTHLNDMVDRSGEVVEEYWTLDTVPGERLDPGTPVYVLTSPHTFSGAEEFSYNLKTLGRGAIVGEQTGGGAHPVRPERISDRLVLGVPYMRAHNPITKTNWEGVGVEPDIRTPAAEALDHALELARHARDARPHASH